MDPSPSADSSTGERTRTALLDLAESAIRDRLDRRSRPDVDVDALPVELRRPGGVFVTLLVRGELNGCIGNLDSRDPIGISVPRLAVESAFHDPRLPALGAADLPHLHIEVSLLSRRAPVPAVTRAELLANLRPGVDGLVLASGRRSAVFLPSVWEQLADPNMFVDRLLAKAGLLPAAWPNDMRAEVFTAEKFGRDVG